MTYQEARKSGLRVRFKTWWWGRWVQWVENRWLDESGKIVMTNCLCTTGLPIDGAWEFYNEKEHGVLNETNDSGASSSIIELGK